MHDRRTLTEHFDVPVDASEQLVADLEEKNKEMFLNRHGDLMKQLLKFETDDTDQLEFCYE